MTDASAPSPLVVALAPIDGRRSRYRITLDDDSTLDIAAEVLARDTLGVGDPLDRGDRARLVDADLRWRIREAALNLLAVRPRARGELARRLLGRGFSGDALDATLDQLQAQSLLDDSAFSRSFVRDRLRLKPKGRRRLLQELREKGVVAEIAEAAIEGVFAEEEVNEEQLAADAALAWLRRQSSTVRSGLAASGHGSGPVQGRRRALTRLRAHLARRGFAGRVQVAALDAAVEAARSGNA